MNNTEVLYPFLSTAGEQDDPLAEVARSTAAKAREIVALRREVADQLGPRITAAAAAMADAFRAGGWLFTFGNGGSSTDAASLAQLFASGGGTPAGRPLAATALTADAALLTALTNDIGFDVVFARPLAAHGRPGDIACGLSTSGGSANVLRGFEQAHRGGMLTVGIAGSGGGPMVESASIDHLFVVPSASVHRIQEAQTTVYHVLWELIQQALVSEG